jgi:hypothetical protein
MIKKVLGKHAVIKKTLGRSSPAKKAKRIPEEGLVLTTLLLEDVKDISYMNQDHLVYEFAVRWWYALPSPWPPVDYDYSTKLREHGLRRVDQSRFKSEPEVVDGLRKVYEIESYAGLFKDMQGRSYDLRPQETCPSLNNFLKKDRSELQVLLMKAYEEQLQTLLDLHRHGTQYDRLYVVRLIRTLQAKIVRLSRYAPPSTKLHMEPLTTFTSVTEREEVIDQGEEEDK